MADHVYAALGLGTPPDWSWTAHHALANGGPDEQCMDGRHRARMPQNRQMRERWLLGAVLLQALEDCGRGHPRGTEWAGRTQRAIDWVLSDGYIGGIIRLSEACDAIGVTYDHYVDKCLERHHKHIG
jgi:hypothetical protein